MLSTEFPSLPSPDPTHAPRISVTSDLLLRVGAAEVAKCDIIQAIFFSQIILVIKSDLIKYHYIFVMKKRIYHEDFVWLL